MSMYLRTIHKQSGQRCIWLIEENMLYGKTIDDYTSQDWCFENIDDRFSLVAYCNNHDIRYRNCYIWDILTDEQMFLELL